MARCGNSKPGDAGKSAGQAPAVVMSPSFCRSRLGGRYICAKMQLKSNPKRSKRVHMLTVLQLNCRVFQTANRLPSFQNRVHSNRCRQERARESGDSLRENYFASILVPSTAILSEIVAGATTTVFRLHHVCSLAGSQWTAEATTCIWRVLKRHTSQEIQYSTACVKHHVELTRFVRQLLLSYF
jgi:hypothetical protein